MKILFAWDFHGVLEKGAIISLVEAMNIVGKEFGFDRKLTLEDIKPYFGLKWVEFYKGLFSVDEELAQKMVERSNEVGIETARKHCIANEYAKEVLEQIRKRDDVFFRYVSFKYGQKRVMRIYTNE